MVLLLRNREDCGGVSATREGDEVSGGDVTRLGIDGIDGACISRRTGTDRRTESTSGSEQKPK